ncbi:cytochrome P450 CYP82D47-like [Punica granatum]|uniref:Cytochrome P450 CYP82D47-like n=1 Tax=Punica granatum TaxID=22663 RepID=A0A6P8EI49_PUNGR|nr:cytochrome P450 CYP82D47-like [Punica granatum]
MEELADHLSLSAPTILITIFALFMSILYITSLITRKGESTKTQSAGDVTKMMAPDAGGSWPLFGHLHLLGGPCPTHLVLAQMADKCGPIFTIRLGLRRAVVVNSWELAKECLTSNDRALATRPKTLSSEILTYNYAMVAFSPYSPYWRRVRKISTLELLSTHRISLLRQVRESEVLALVRDIYQEYRRKNASSISDSRAEPASLLHVDMERWFRDISMNLMFRMIVGKRFHDDAEGDEEGRKALGDWMELMGRFVVSDGLPFLRWLDLGGHEKAMKKTAKKLDLMAQRWLDEHKARRNLDGEAGAVKSEKDFMDVLLSILDGNAEIGSYDSDTINKAMCLTMILAGIDTTTVTMTWATSLLLNNKEALKKVQQELDTQIGRDRQVNELDLKNLPYLQSVIKETLRLYPPGPLSIPHEAIEDCNISGYFVAKGTQLILNLYKIQRDPHVWPDPSEFRPERFLTTHKDVEVRGQNFEFIPFGSGRRMCPGISLGLQVIGLPLASFLHAFIVQTPGGEAVDMQEAMGLTNLKATPLEVLATPRVPECVYCK